MRKAKIDRQKLFTVFCVYCLALAASIFAGESYETRKSQTSQEIESARSVTTPDQSQTEIEM